MRKICVGIHLHAQPQQLQATVESVRRTCPPGVELVLLPDGADAQMKRALRAWGELPQLATERALGAAACFNRLATYSDAAIVALLESGSRVAPGWLEQLIAALEADPAHGLAGPSTNQAWNEQGVFVHAAGAPAEIAATARLARQRFGGAIRTLEPLYSLADFCYVVKREVIDAIGGADERYGLGPCWEMDYNLRAARAGFQGVWVCGAYVWRAPFTSRRRQEEAARFEASKRLYQDTFCALRLTGQRAGYESHCRGEACEHFAPVSLIEAGSIRLSLPIGNPPNQEVEVVAPSTTHMVANEQHSSTLPLVSCIMPTANRPDFVRQAIGYFQRQSYANRELIIVDDEKNPEIARYLDQELAGDARIRYVTMGVGRSIGAKRNHACELARGSIIAQWDDDDWYGPGRLAAQVAPLLAGEAEICGLATGLIFDLSHWEFWSCTPELHRRIFEGDVHGGTLVFQRRVWERLARYPDRSLAEDAYFLRQAMRRGARLCRLPNDDHFIYVRHAQNSWAFVCGQFINPQGWQRRAEPSISAEERAFYRAHSPVGEKVTVNVAPPVAVHEARAATSPLEPLVSCIMPTANRRAFVPHAIRYFQQQSYVRRELIIVDDGVEAIGDLVPEDERIRYVRLEKRRTIGAKRNLACEEAGGEIIVHWDDDDWFAPWRLEYQVKGLLQGRADICGLTTLFYYDPQARQAWRYCYPAGQRQWVTGCTLCYTRTLWKRSPFPDINVGEDTRFVWSGAGRRIVALPNANFYVAMIHAGNASVKTCRGPYWSRWPGDLREVAGDALEFYHMAVGSGVRERG
jgi:glycosyltransferase involved in cell wall biosynthesis